MDPGCNLQVRVNTDDSLSIVRCGHWWQSVGEGRHWWQSIYRWGVDTDYNLSIGEGGHWWQSIGEGGYWRQSIGEGGHRWQSIVEDGHWWQSIYQEWNSSGFSWKSCFSNSNLFFFCETLQFNLFIFLLDDRFVLFGLDFHIKPQR